MLVENQSHVAVRVKVIDENKDKKTSLLNAKVVLTVLPHSHASSEEIKPEKLVYIQFVDVPYEMYYKLGRSNSAVVTSEWVTSKLKASPLHWATFHSDAAAVQQLLDDKSVDVNAQDANGSSPLHYAARRGDLAIARLLLAAPGTLVDIADKGDDTPLHEAAQYNHTAFIRMLVEEFNANVLATSNTSQWTPLHEAAQEGALEAVQLLIEAFRVDIKARNRYGQTALLSACYGGSLDIVKYLVENGADVNVENLDGDTALMKASRNGHLDIVKYLAERRVDVNVQDKAGETALMACTNSNLDIVRYLVEIGAEVNLQDKDGCTALMKACNSGNLVVVKYLVENGADVKVQNLYGWTALMKASQAGNLDIVKHLIERGVDVNVQDKAGETALMACTNSNLDIVSYLVEIGAEVNHQNKDGSTALMKACSSGNLEVVKYLVEKGADVNVQNLYGRTALMKASQAGNLDIVKYLVERRVDVNVHDKGGETALMACTNNHLDIVRYLVEFGAQVNHQKKDGYSALMKACSSGNLEVVKYLVEKGADVNAQNLYGDTALMKATRNGHLDIVKYLVENGADVNVQSLDGDTALMTATRNGHLDIVKYLVERRVDVNVQDKAGETALMACTNSNLDIVRYLVEIGAEVNLQDKDGCTALMKACNSGNLVVVKYLVEKGADVNVQDKEGETVLMRTCRSGNTVVVKYLVDRGADVNVQNEDGNTALHIAVCANMYDVVLYLIQQQADLEVINADQLTPLQYAIEKKQYGFMNHYSYTCFLLVKAGAAIPFECDDAMMQLALDYWRDRYSKHLPITEIPNELFDAKDENRMRDYLQKASKDVGDGDHIYRMRVMLLGNFEAGKTSLKNALLYNRAMLVEKEDRTIGIDTFNWRMQLCLNESTNEIESFERVTDLHGKSNVEMSVWDFAGQEEYYQTHQIFTRSKKSIYVLVVNLEKYDESSEMGFKSAVGQWLDILQANIPGVDPIIVGTHIDKLDRSVVQQKCTDIITKLRNSESRLARGNEDEIKEIIDQLDTSEKNSTLNAELLNRLKLLQLDRPRIPDRVIPISNAEGIENVKQLERKLLELTVHPSRSIILPSTYSLFRSKLTRIKSGISHLTDLTALVESCNEEKKLNGSDRIEEDSMISILKLLDELGDVLFFDSTQLSSNEEEQSPSIIINNPEYLLDLIKDIVHHAMRDLENGPLNSIRFKLNEDKSEFVDKGVLSHELLGEFEHWKALGTQNQIEMRHLLKMFDIMYAIDEDTSLVPCYLPRDEQVSLTDWQHENQANLTVGKDFLFDSYVPPGLSARMAVRCSNSFTSSELFSRSMYLQKYINDKKVSLLFYQTWNPSGYGGTVTIAASAETASDAWIVLNQVLCEFLDLLKLFAGTAYYQTSIFGCSGSSQLFRTSGKDKELRKKVNNAKKDNSKVICFLTKNKLHQLLSNVDLNVSRTIDVPIELLLPLKDLQNYLDGHLQEDTHEDFPLAEASVGVAKQRQISGAQVGDLVRLCSSGKDGVVEMVNGSELVVKIGNGIAEKASFSDLVPLKFSVFLSHAQLEAQNTCMALYEKLNQANVKCWYDMASENLTVSGMCRGVMNSNVFLVYLTKAYFSRWFCRMEFSVAVKAKKKVLIVYETDNRFGGVNGEYLALLKEATKEYPKYLNWIHRNCGESIPYYRRAALHEASMQSIIKQITNIEDQLKPVDLPISHPSQTQNVEAMSPLSTHPHVSEAGPDLSNAVPVREAEAKEIQPIIDYTSAGSLLPSTVAQNVIIVGLVALLGLTIIVKLK